MRRTKSEIERLVDTSHDSAQAEWESAQAFANAHPAYTEIFSDGRGRTIFTNEYRFAALDPDDPRIAEGLRISLTVLKRLNEQAVARNIRFVVVLIPTKETVFRAQSQNTSASVRVLTDPEQLFWRTTKEFLERNGIEYLDSLPALREQLGTGMQPYPVSSDGHPNELGHGAIARVVAAYLQSQQ